MPALTKIGRLLHSCFFGGMPGFGTGLTCFMLLWLIAAWGFAGLVGLTSLLIFAIGVNALVAKVGVRDSEPMSLPSTFQMTPASRSELGAYWLFFVAILGMGAPYIIRPISWT